MKLKERSLLYECEIINQTIRSEKGNRTRAAMILGITRGTLYEKLQRGERVARRAKRGGKAGGTKDVERQSD